LLLQNVLDHRKREEVAILKFFDEANAFYIAVVIFRSVPSPFEGLGKESFPDVKMNGLLGYAGMLNQVSDLQKSSCPACGGLTRDCHLPRPGCLFLKEYY
jgi:hypothetical protein